MLSFTCNERVFQGLYFYDLHNFNICRLARDLIIHLDNRMSIEKRKNSRLSNWQSLPPARMAVPCHSAGGLVATP